MGRGNHHGCSSPRSNHAPLLRHRTSNDTIQVLRDAFINVAGLRPQDLMPGFAIWDGQRDPEKGNAFATSVEEDLRLPGVFLSSFFEFADRYYGRYKSTTAAPRSPLNRHAIMHGVPGFRSEANAARILTFVDLTLALEPVFRFCLTAFHPSRIAAPNFTLKPSRPGFGPAAEPPAPVLLGRRHAARIRVESKCSERRAARPRHVGLGRTA